MLAEADATLGARPQVVTEMHLLTQRRAVVHEASMSAFGSLSWGRVRFEFRVRVRVVCRATRMRRVHPTGQKQNFSTSRSMAIPIMMPPEARITQSAAPGRAPSTFLAPYATPR